MGLCQIQCGSANLPMLWVGISTPFADIGPGQQSCNSELGKEVAAGLHLDLTCGAGGVFPYAISEMLNNAIDHSEGTTATIKFFKKPETWAFEIIDDGCGVFSKIMTEFNLQNVSEAVGELTKWKRTTAGPLTIS